MGALVSVRNIVKRFAGTVALDGVSFDIHASQVHILLGENGAGKSTLMKILSGIYEPSESQIQLGDTQYASLTPSISKAYGIALIYQELSVIDYLSIEENLFVGRLPTRKVLGVSM
ncbi:ATP-binding cassette domain-containing protein, partial [Pseudomonas gingeri]|uniref:ATP-binding cassette domain-containing protein n=1 Tax=Pseudomonas gingeri TaxID=117681 RepID=UPI0015A0CA65